ncbi:MAG: hypothetical protein JSW61_05755 [Candidatus Thorarchaeota archaeon]|nr:MAG: hypothetical protein JSW61_05755 [Candidatus Thorarchaeota archaeon]
MQDPLRISCVRNMEFYPSEAKVPEELRTDEFVLRPLRVIHAEMDYAALMDSKESLRMMSQSSWPSDDFTLEENRADLQEHEKEHIEREAFTYTVLDSTGDTCLGCIYIEHLKEGPMKGDHAAMLRFWVRQPRLADDLDRRVLDALMEWFRKDWAFSRVVFTIADVDERQRQLAKDLDLRLVRSYGGKWSEYLILDQSDSSTPG